MKAHLLFPDRDPGLQVNFSPRLGFTVEAPSDPNKDQNDPLSRLGKSDPAPELPWNAGALAQDLELSTLLQAIANGDVLIFEVAKQMLFNPLTSVEEIRYRQEILADCLAHPDVAREIYGIALDAIKGEQSVWTPFGGHPNNVLDRSVRVLDIFVGLLKRLRALADENAATMQSKGMADLCAMLARELDDDYFATVDEHLERLKFKAGTLMSARLGVGNRGKQYVLRAPRDVKLSFRERIGFDPPNSFSFQLAPRDEAGGRFLSDLKDRGVNLAANALAQSTDHITNFFKLLACEFGFYVGCLNLADHLAEKNEPITTPDAVSDDQVALSYRGIYDVCLSLRSEGTVVGNDAEADGKMLLMITGANSGGKSTLLRSIGLAELMMQAGMFVGAVAYSANICHAMFSHFIREEDETMTSGKLDEELARMSAIADRIGTGDLMLFNESFAATNEREGSEIARQVITALLEADIKVVFVTHQFTLADSIYSEGLDTAMFLRAERGEEGKRSFKVVEEPPLPTSFGEDLFNRLGGWKTATDEPSVPVGVAVANDAGAEGDAGGA